MSRGTNMFGKNPLMCFLFGHKMVLMEDRAFCERCEIPTIFENGAYCVKGEQDA